MDQPVCDKTKDCKMCHKKSGLPIFLTRYAVASKDSKVNKDHYGKQAGKLLGILWNEDPLLGSIAVPPLEQSFKVEDTLGGKTIELGKDAQYTLRLLRPGYVYVFNPKDPEGRKWRAYVVTEEQYLLDFDPYPSPCNFPSAAPECKKKDEGKTQPCLPDKNGCAARCITIPGADLAEIVWIGFSDTKWPYHMMRANEQSEKLRERHMRRLDVSKYLKGTEPKDHKHIHAVCVHALPEQNGIIKPIIAEYAYAALGHKRDDPGLFGFSPIKFPRLGSPGVVTRFPEPPKPDPKNPPVIDARQYMEDLNQRYHGGFTHLVREFERFYAREDKDGKNAGQYKGAGMILALDDAPGIAMDLAGLMEVHMYAFKTQDTFRRPVMVNECIRQAMTATRGHAIQKIKNEKLGMWAVLDPNAGISNEQVGELLALTDFLSHPDTVDLYHQALWKKYSNENLDIKKWESFSNPKADDTNQPKYVEKSIEFGKAVVDDLAKAHAAWFSSNYLIDHFVCNFDRSEDAWREHGGPYVTLLNLCVGGTGEHPICRDAYEKMRRGKLDEYNLVWMGINLNRQKLADNIQKTTQDIEAIKKKAQEFANKNPAALSLIEPAVDQDSLLDSMTQFIAQIGWSWSDAFNNARQACVEAFSQDVERDLKAIEDIKKAREQAEANYETEKAYANKYIRETMRAFDERHKKRLVSNEKRTGSIQQRANVDTARANAAKAEYIASLKRSTATLAEIDSNTSWSRSQTAMDIASGKMTEAIDAELAAQGKEGIAKQAETDAQNKWQTAEKQFDRAAQDSEAATRAESEAAQLQGEADRAIAKRLVTEQAIKRMTRNLAGVLGEFEKAIKNLPPIDSNTPLGRLMTKFQTMFAQMAAKLPVQALNDLSMNSGHIMLALAAHAGDPGLILKTTADYAGMRRIYTKLFGPEIGGELFPENTPKGRNHTRYVKVSVDSGAIHHSSPAYLAGKDWSEVALRFQASGPGVNFDTRAMISSVLELHNIKWIDEALPQYAKMLALQQKLLRMIDALSHEQKKAAWQSIDAWRKELNAKSAADAAHHMRHLASESEKSFDQKFGDAEQAERRKGETRQAADDARRHSDATSQDAHAAAQESDRLEQEAVAKEQHKVSTRQEAVAAGREHLQANETVGKEVKLDEKMRRASDVAKQAYLDAHNTAIQMQKELEAVFGREKAVELERRATENWEREVELKEIAIDAMRARMVGVGSYAAFNALMAWAVLAHWGGEFEKAEALEGPEHNKIMSMYYASAANMAAAVADCFAVTVTTAAQLRNWPWAVGLSKLAAASLFGYAIRGAGSVLSFTEAFWNYQEGNKYFEEGEKGWGRGYYVAALLGIASGVATASGKFNIPTIIIMIAYAAYMTAFGMLAPTKLERWLEHCYFGRRPNKDWDEDQGGDWPQEMISFALATGQEMSKADVKELRVPGQRYVQGQ